MAYYQDLTKYTYMDTKEDKALINIGWLDKDHMYKKGRVDEDILRKILLLCKKPENKTRGYHVCPYCSDPMFGVSVVIDNQTIKLGSAEIWVEAYDKKIFVAPDLIYHYIKEHDYLPPEEFLSALRKIKL